MWLGCQLFSYLPFGVTAKCQFSGPLTLTEQLTACSRLAVQSQQVAKIHCQQIGLLTLVNASGQGAIPWGGIYFLI